MVSQVLVRGRVLHAKMTPDKVLDRITSYFPQTELTGQDFTILLAECQVSCFRSSSTTLDFSIEIDLSANSSKSGPQRVVAATETLVRSTDTVWTGFHSALRSGYVRGAPKMDFCVIEDALSKHSLIVREQQSPLRSPAAKVSYFISILFLAIMAYLIHWQAQVHQSSSSKLANMLTVIIPLAIAAVGTPVPVVIQWLEWKKSLVWRYVRSST
jgi:hypothetical protein